MRKQAGSRQTKYIIDRTSFIIQLIALLSLVTVGFSNMNNLEYPLISRDSFKMCGYLLFGLFLQGVLSIAINGTIKFGNLYDEEKTVFQAGLTLGIVALIQVTVYFLFNQAIFQVTAIDVYAFFISSAIAEESLLRAGMIPAGMILLKNKTRDPKYLAVILLVIGTLFYMFLDPTFLIYIVIGLVICIMAVLFLFRDQADKKKYTTEFKIRAIFIVFITSLLFVFSHERYLDTAYLFVGTFFCGIVFGIAFVYTKNPLVTILAHAFVNFQSSGTIIQTLGV